MPDNPKTNGYTRALFWVVTVSCSTLLATYGFLIRTAYADIRLNSNTRIEVTTSMGYLKEDMKEIKEGMRDMKAGINTLLGKKGFLTRK